MSKIYDFSARLVSSITIVIHTEVYLLLYSFSYSHCLSIFTRQFKYGNQLIILRVSH